LHTDITTFNLKHLVGSKKGTNRNKNQDRFLIIEKDGYSLFMVFDGVSSNQMSYLFINEFKKRVRFKSKVAEISENTLSKVLYEINIKLIQSGLEGMSTLSLLFFNKIGNNVEFLNIGDSRIYIFTNQYLEKITEDDALLGRNNIITKYLGLEALTLDDFQLEKTSNDCNYLMCTDGFYTLMENELKEYFTTLNFRKLRNIKKKLLSLQKGNNSDDSSYIIIKNEISN
jgi:serine/threonine protein phosphatase PrpC